MSIAFRHAEVVLERIQGHDPEDPYSADEKPAPPSDPDAVKTMTIGYLRLDFAKQGDKSVEKAFLAALDDLRRAGARLEEAKLPDLPFEAAASVVLTAEVATAFEEDKGISLARFFQGITSWHLKRPPIDGLTGMRTTGAIRPDVAGAPSAS